MSLTKGQLGFLLGLIFLVLLVGWYALSVHEKGSSGVTSESSPAVTALTPTEENAAYTDLAGNPVALDDYIGKVLVVNSWASWSPASAKELTMLSEFADNYKAREVKVLAVNRQEPASTAERFLRATVVGSELQLILDPTDHYYTSIEGYAMPETLIYDRAGNVVHHARGPVTPTVLQQKVDQALDAE